MPLVFQTTAVTPAQAIETVVPAAMNSQCVLVGTNLYYLTTAEVGATGPGPPAYEGNLWVMKSSDNGFTWSQVGNVALALAQNPISLCVTGTIIRFVTIDQATGQIVILNWQTATDTLLANSALGPVAAGNPLRPLSAVAYSDGTILAVYSDSSLPENGMAVIYTPGSDSWGAPSQFFAGSDPVALVKEHATDRAYCFFMTAAGTALGCLTITNPLTFGAVTAISIPWSALLDGQAYRPGLPCINGVDAEIIFPFLSTGDSNNVPANVLSVARAACDANPTFTFEVVNATATLPAGQFLTCWLGFSQCGSVAISSGGLLYVFFVAINTLSAQDPATVGYLYYQQNSGPGLGWGSPVNVVTTAVPNAYAQLSPVTLSPTAFGLFTSTFDAPAFFSAVGNDKYNSLANFFLSTGAAPPLGIACGNPPGGTSGTPYSHAFPASSGTPPYTFAITAGSLPPGLTLDPATGIVSGTPTVPGTFPFTIQVTDSA